MKMNIVCNKNGNKYKLDLIIINNEKTDYFLTKNTNLLTNKI